MGRGDRRAGGLWAVGEQQTSRAGVGDTRQTETIHRERERDRDSVSGKERPGRAKNRHLGGWGLEAEGWRLRGQERLETGERQVNGGKQRNRLHPGRPARQGYTAEPQGGSGGHRGRNSDGQARQGRQTTDDQRTRGVPTHYLTAKLRSIAASPPSGLGAICCFRLFCLFSGPRVSCQQVFVGS